MQQAQQQRQRQRDLARNAPRVQCETRQGEPRRLLWSNKMPATDQREGGADTMQAGCSSSSPRENQNKRDSELAIGNCELRTANSAEPNSHQFFFGQSVAVAVAGFELWLELTSLLFLLAQYFCSFFHLVYATLLLLLLLHLVWFLSDFSVAKLVRGCCACCVWATNWPNVYKRL